MGPGNPLGETSRFTSTLGRGGMTPQMAAYQQILSLLPNIGGQHLGKFCMMLMAKLGIHLRALGVMRVSRVLVVPQFRLDQGSFIPVHQDPQGF